MSCGPSRSSFKLSGRSYLAHIANDFCQIVQKLWNYCNVLRDDEMSYGDYPSTGYSAKLRTGVEQLTYLHQHSFGSNL